MTAVNQAAKLSIPDSFREEEEKKKEEREEGISGTRSIMKSTLFCSEIYLIIMFHP